MNWTAENVVLDDQEADNAWVNETTLHSCVRVEGDNGVLAFVCAATDDAARTAADEIERPREMDIAHLEALLEDRERVLADLRNANKGKQYTDPIGRVSMGLLGL